jgi:uncharacterized membrane protein YoaK (UPF0700 family)
MEGKKEDSILVALLLTLTGGFLDAYTFMLRGGTFANAQTGNIVMTGVNLAKGNAGDAFVLVRVPMGRACRGIGILCSVFCMKNFKFKRFITWQGFILLFETIALVLAGFVPIESKYDDIVVVTISFITAMQYGAFKHMKDCTYATTMCTGMLRNATELLYKIIDGTEKKSEKSVCLKLYIIIFTFCIGCGIGAIFSNLIGAKSVWVCAIIMFTVSFILVYEEKKNYNAVAAANS